MNWDLSDPKQAREFLKSVRIGDKGKTEAKIEFLKTESGHQITIEEASDEQILGLVNKIAEAMNKKD